MTFAEYFINWAETYKRDNVRKVTYEKYKNTWKSLKKIAPSLDISELTRVEYQNIINEYAKTHEVTTVRDFHTQLKSSLADAVEDGIIQKDPASKVVIKGKEHIKKHDSFLNHFDAQLLIKSLDLGSEINSDYLIFLLIKTGLRFAEAIAITPRDFDFETQNLHITKTLNYKDGIYNVCFQPTKNKSSVRDVTLDYKTLNKFSKVIKDIPPDKPIFTYGKCSVVNSTLNNFLRKKCKELNIPLINVHGLRHTHASILLANGVSIASVARRLGHSNMATTQKVYLHVIKELENKDNALSVAAMANLDI